MPLKLSLKPGEAVVVNGAVIRNGDRRGTFLLETRARILRERDILFQEDVRSTADAAYFAVMQMYLTGETEGPLYDASIAALAELVEDVPDEASKLNVLDVSRAIAAGQIYKALGACRKLIPRAETAGAVNG